jgi:hypothetical protein
MGGISRNGISHLLYPYGQKVYGISHTAAPGETVGYPTKALADLRGISHRDAAH